MNFFVKAVLSVCATVEKPAVPMIPDEAYAAIVNGKKNEDIPED